MLGGRIIVKVLEKQEEQIESIVIPKSANADLTEGLVVMVDNDIEKYIKKGDIVVFPTGSGVGQFIDNKPHLWLSPNDVWGGFSIDQE